MTMSEICTSVIPNAHGDWLLPAKVALARLLARWEVVQASQGTGCCHGDEDVCTAVSHYLLSMLSSPVGINPCQVWWTQVSFGEGDRGSVPHMSIARTRQSVLFARTRAEFGVCGIDLAEGARAQYVRMLHARGDHDA